MTLERPTGSNVGKDTKLWGTGCFHASVYPDLPAFMKWPDLLDINRFRQARKPMDLEKLRAESCAGKEEGLIVRTVGVQLRGREGLQRRLLLRAGLQDSGDAVAGVRPADALLLVSGSHPLRRALAWSGMLRDSVDALRLAGNLRQQGLLPVRTSLWAVANPLVDTAESLERKVAAGAEVILTQPPLIYPKFESWFSRVERLGLTKEARLVIGIPMLTSSWSMQFWLELCSAVAVEGASQTLSPFIEAEQHGPAELQTFTYKFSSELVGKVLQLPGVSGLHVMPVSGRGRALALQLAQNGCFQPRTHDFLDLAAPSA